MADVRDMAIIHETFRRLYAESAALVRANPAPSPERVTFLGDHIAFGLEMLHHHHHESEDQLLYPLLIERVPEQAETTERIDHEHQAIATALDSAQEACRAWRASPGAETGEALAAALDHVNEITQPHLDHEEQVVVPLAAQHLSQEEWDALGEHSRSYVPRERMPAMFGMITEPLSKPDADFMKQSLPAPVRLLYPVLIGRAWKKYADTLRNGT